MYERSSLANMSNIPTPGLENKDRRNAADIRKSNKPLLEKKRRARINKSLDQLKGLLMEAIKNDASSGYSKLEKADILEIAVRHLRQMQKHQLAAATSLDPSVTGRYRDGFSECAQEVNRYLSSIDGLGIEVRMRLMNHLAECISSRTLNKSPPTVQRTCQSHTAAPSYEFPGSIMTSPIELTASLMASANPMTSVYDVRIPHASSVSPFSMAATSCYSPDMFEHSMNSSQSTSYHDGSMIHDGSLIRMKGNSSFQNDVSFSFKQESMSDSIERKPLRDFHQQQRPLSEINLNRLTDNGQVRSAGENVDEFRSGRGISGSEFQENGQCSSSMLENIKDDDDDDDSVWRPW